MGRPFPCATTPPTDEELPLAFASRGPTLRYQVAWEHPRAVRLMLPHGLDLRGEEPQPEKCTEMMVGKRTKEAFYD